MKTIFSVLLFITISTITIAQYDGAFSRQYFTAENLIEAGNYDDALDVYLELSKLVPSDANINFKVGFCYLNTKSDKKKAIPYLEKAIGGISEEYDPGDPESQSAPLETYYYLGEAYHLNYQFDESIEMLENLKSQLTESDKEFIEKIDWKITQCQNGSLLMKFPVKMIVSNLGDQINTPFKEHSPVFSADESVLIFTSKKEGSTGGKMTDGEFYEDIYVSYKTEEELWSDPISIGANINSDGHEASIGLSVDGSQLFIYKDDNGDGNIYFSELKGDSWTSPTKMGPTINTKYNETHASISADGKEIYFTSDRKGGYGGLDIYVVRKLPNGEWGKAQNLGPTINTELNERCPFIHPDGVTVFFSSEKHMNMGGFDIFFSIKNDEGGWEEPTNMGYPINTTEDDVFYTPTPDGKRAYYASQQTEGQGSTDIYMLTLPGSEEKELTVMSGTVTLSDGTKPENVYIEVTDADNGDIVGTYTPNSKTGKYLFILKPGKTYNVLCENEGFEPYEEQFTVPVGSAYQQIKRAILLDPIVFTVDNGDNNQDNNDTNNNNDDNNTKSGNDDNNNSDSNNDDSNDNINNKDTEDNTNNDPGPDVTISAVYFDFDMKTTEKYYQEMDKLASYLKSNPQAVIIIEGHTDAQGDEIYNNLLGKWRAEFVQKYLINKGINKDNLKTRSLGETKLVAVDLAPFTRKYNRRVEFKVEKMGAAKIKFVTQEIPNEYKIK
jgi:outer membrane protein OmpA-like peptidoglycan-associated protein/Tol biopolymer transport system component